MQLEGFVQSERAEQRFAGRVARVAQRSRVQASEQATSARLRAEEAAASYRAVLAEVLDKRHRGKSVSTVLQARLDAALVAMDEANDAVSALFGTRLVA